MLYHAKHLGRLKAIHQCLHEQRMNQADQRVVEIQTVAVCKLASNCRRCFTRIPQELLLLWSAVLHSRVPKRVGLCRR